jgi:hypothetical protein
LWTAGTLRKDGWIVLGGMIAAAAEQGALRTLIVSYA